MYVQRLGRAAWERHTRAVEATWQTIRERLAALRLDYRRVRLYQDGLPDCGREAAIVEELALAGSLNHQLLLDLMKQGAALTGTESPQLLLDEYELTRRELASLKARRAAPLAARVRRLGDQMLERRDRSIAERIGATLAPGETGIVFLGMLHSLDGRLPRDIELVLLGGQRSEVGGQRVRNPRLTSDL